MKMQLREIFKLVLVVILIVAIIVAYLLDFSSKAKPKVTSQTLTVSSVSPRIRDKISSQVERGKKTNQVLQKSSEYVDDVQKADRVHYTNDEWLNWYVPQIKKFAEENIKKYGPKYFEKSEAGRKAKIQHAIEINMKTKELAAIWRQMKGGRYTNNSGRYTNNKNKIKKDRIIVI